MEDRIYWIQAGWHALVEQIAPKTKLVLCSFCIHPYADAPLPAGDRAIGQKLLLDGDEKEFWRLANRRAA